MTKKINWILILQAWAIIWVVIGHSFMTLPFDDFTPKYVKVTFDIAYSFHMSLFIFVSGYLFYMTRIQKQMSYVRMILDKLKRLGIPFVVFTLFAMVLKTIFSDDMSRASQISIREFVSAILYPNDGPMREFWFIAVIMWCFAFMPLWKYLLKSIKGTIIGLVATLAFAIWNPMFFNDFLCFPRFLHYVFYFLCGMACYRWNVYEQISAYRYLILGVSLICYLFIFLLVGVHGGIILAITGIIFSIVLAIVVNHYSPKVFLSFQNYTYQIYLMGIFFQIFIKMLYNKHLISYGGGYLLCIILGIYGPVLVSIVINKINWNPLCLAIGIHIKNSK